MRITASLVGTTAAAVSILLWTILVFINPYRDRAAIEIDTLVVTLATLLFPACLALYSSLRLKNKPMFVSFFWSLPVSLYLTGTPGIFKFFGLTSVLYLASAVLMFINKAYINKKGTHD